MTAQEFIDAIEAAYAKVFPKGHIRGRFFSAMGRPSLMFDTRLQGDLNKLPNKTPENDVAPQRFTVDVSDASPDSQLPDKITIESNRSSSLLVRPAPGSGMAFDSVRFGWRRKTGTPEQVVRHMTAYFQKMKKVLEANRKRLPKTHEVPARVTRDIVATLVRAGRRDLACVVAKLFTGHTFDAKDILKRHGARWKPQQKAWDVPDNRVEKAAKELEANGFDVKVQPDGVKVFRKRGGGSGSRPVSPRPAGPTRPSPRQVDYAYKLVQRAIRSGDWHDTDMGQGAPPPTRQDLEQMSSKDVSYLIDDLKR